MQSSCLLRSQNNMLAVNQTLFSYSAYFNAYLQPSLLPTPSPIKLLGPFLNIQIWPALGYTCLLAIRLKASYNGHLSRRQIFSDSIMFLLGFLVRLFLVPPTFKFQQCYSMVAHLNNIMISNGSWFSIIVAQSLLSYGVSLRVLSLLFGLLRSRIRYILDVISGTNALPTSHYFMSYPISAPPIHSEYIGE